ncbi:hypothetical protein MIR68_007663 [Amoeboaphelidium protococcarum]|nr:hypothetical protein MIR68_007663 [Amoeboaphelidium protococcarum]
MKRKGDDEQSPRQDKQFKSLKKDEDFTQLVRRIKQRSQKRVDNKRLTQSNNKLDGQKLSFMYYGPNIKSSLMAVNQVDPQDLPPFMKIKAQLAHQKTLVEQANVQQQSSASARGDQNRVPDQQLSGTAQTLLKIIKKTSPQRFQQERNTPQRAQDLRSDSRGSIAANSSFVVSSSPIQQKPPLQKSFLKSKPSTTEVQQQQREIPVCNKPYQPPVDAIQVEDSEPEVIDLTSSPEVEKKSQPPPPATDGGIKILGSLSHLVRKDVWNCDVCCAENKLSDAMCLCCETPKPGSQQQQQQQQQPSVPASVKPPVSEPAVKIIGSLSHLVQKDVWNCDVCCAENKNSTLICLCCEAPKPGSESKSSDQQPAGIQQLSDTAAPPKAQITPGGFRFGDGGAVTSQQSIASPAFTFGSQPKSDQKVNTQPLPSAPVTFQFKGFGTPSTTTSFVITGQDTQTESVDSKDDQKTAKEAPDQVHTSSNNKVPQVSANNDANADEMNDGQDEQTADHFQKPSEQKALIDSLPQFEFKVDALNVDFQPLPSSVLNEASLFSFAV